MTNNDFFSDFIRRYGNKHDFEDRLLNDYIQSEEDMGDFDSEDDFYDQWDPETEIYMLETEFRNFQKEVDKNIKDVKVEIEKQIKEALDNPLAN